MMSNKIDINHAGVEALTTLPGIAEKLADRIVEYRETVHPFEELIELAAVPGISERMVRKIENQLTIESPPEIEIEIGSEIEAFGDDEDGETAVSTTDDHRPLSGQAVTPDLEIDEESTLEDAPADDIPPHLEQTIDSNPEEEPEPVSLSILPEPESTLVMARTNPEEQTTVRAHLFSVVAGAVLGAALVFLPLLLFNGTLRFAGNSRTDEIQEQIDQNLDAINQDQAGMSGDMEGIIDELNALTEQAATLTVMQETLEGDLTAVQADFEALQTDMNTAQKDVTALEADTAALEESTMNLDERLSVAAKSAENFDTYLNSLRDLLIDLQGLPRSPTATATVKVTRTATAAATDTATPIATTAPTRTPRSTATPLVQPSPTPAP